MTKSELHQAVMREFPEGEWDVDNENQVIVYTGLYIVKDSDGDEYVDNKPPTS